MQWTAPLHNASFVDSFCCLNRRTMVAYFHLHSILSSYISFIFEQEIHTLKVVDTLTCENMQTVINPVVKGLNWGPIFQILNSWVWPDLLSLFVFIWSWLMKHRAIHKIECNCSERGDLRSAPGRTLCFSPVPATVASTGVLTTCDLHHNTLAISMC